jgi:hypothetical protein
MHSLSSPSSGPSHFSLRFFTLSTPPCSVLRISHFDFLSRRPPSFGPSHFSLRLFTVNPLRPIFHISHSDFLIHWSPLPDASHFSLRFFNLSIPPARSFTFPTPLSVRLQGRLLSSPGPIKFTSFWDSRFWRPGSWSMGPDDGSEDLDQDRPQGPFNFSCFEDLDIFRPGILAPWSRWYFWGPGSG